MVPADLVMVSGVGYETDTVVSFCSDVSSENVSLSDRTGKLLYLVSS